jgi:DNA-binding LytR/AlgR family response regulator
METKTKICGNTRALFIKTEICGSTRALIVNCAGENVHIPLNEIRYFGVRCNYSVIHAGAEYETYEIRGMLGKMEKELDDNNFFRMGRSYIINMRYFRKTTKTAIHLTDGTALKLPRGYQRIMNREMIARL